MGSREGIPQLLSYGISQYPQKCGALGFASSDLDSLSVLTSNISPRYCCSDWYDRKPEINSECRTTSGAFFNYKAGGNQTPITVVDRSTKPI